MAVLDGQCRMALRLSDLPFQELNVKQQKAPKAVIKPHNTTCVAKMWLVQPVA
jgi:hypothetical protein